MSDCLYLATRKGLFTADRTNGGWKITRCAFLADPVYIVLSDRRDGRVDLALCQPHLGQSGYGRSSVLAGFPVRFFSILNEFFPAAASVLFQMLAQTWRYLCSLCILHPET